MPGMVFPPDCRWRTLGTSTASWPGLSWPPRLFCSVPKTRGRRDKARRRRGDVIQCEPSPLLIERFNLENGGVVVVAGPEGHRRGGVIDENPANVGLARQQVLDRLSGLRVEPQHAVVRHRAAPQFAISIEIDV